MTSVRRRRRQVGGGIATGMSSSMISTPANQRPAELRRCRRSTAPSPVVPPPLTTTNAGISNDNNVGRLVASRRRSSTIGQVRSGGIEYPTPPTQTQQTTIQQTTRSSPTPPLNEPTNNYVGRSTRRRFSSRDGIGCAVFSTSSRFRHQYQLANNNLNNNNGGISRAAERRRRRYVIVAGGSTR